MHSNKNNILCLPESCVARPFKTGATATSALTRPHTTILLVDDDSSVRESLCRVLAAEGWHVVSADSGEKALEHMREWEPDLLITDLRMTPIDGWDLLFHEKIQRPHLPIFVITALPRRSTVEASTFATEFFRKPIDIDELLAAVRRHLSNGRRLGG